MSMPIRQDLEAIVTNPIRYEGPRKRSKSINKKSSELSREYARRKEYYKKNIEPRLIVKPKFQITMEMLWECLA